MSRDDDDFAQTVVAMRPSFWNWLGQRYVYRSIGAVILLISLFLASLRHSDRAERAAAEAEAKADAGAADAKPTKQAESDREWKELLELERRHAR